MPIELEKKRRCASRLAHVHVNLVPSRELAYVIGVMLGDGSLINSPKNGNYGIELNAVDYDFVRNFSEVVSKILHHHKKPSVHWKRNKRIAIGRMWSCKAYSKDLLTFFIQKQNSFKEFLSTITLFPKDFLRGFFDSEGSVGNKAVRAINTRQDVIHLVKKVLRDIGVHCWKVEVRLPKESVTKTGVIIKQKKVKYCIGFSDPNSLRSFSQVGFSIRRKQQKLETLLIST